MRLTYVLALMTTVMSTAAMADDGATLDEAKAMALKAAAHYRQVGADTALSDFTKSPEWRDRNLYVFAVKNDGTQAANGGNPALVGRNVIDMRDVDGKMTNREMLAIKDQGWVEYKWRNPQTNMVQPKATYVVRVSDDAIVAVGAYKQ
jgi:cytochrome c